MGKSTDPVTLQIIQEALAGIGDEMFAVLKKTAMSPIIYEVLDAGTAVTLADGELAASGSGIPTFVGVLDKAVKRILELRGGPSGIQPGDLYITNDPYYGGVTHLNDVVLALPVFFRRQADRVDAQHRPLERCRRSHQRLDVHGRNRDLAGGAASARSKTVREWKSDRIRHPDDQG